MHSKPVSFLFAGLAVSLLLPAPCRAQAIPGYTITTVAGNGSAGFAGDGGAGNAAQLNGPFSAALDSSGNLYIADQFNHRIRRVGTDGNISTVAGTGTSSFTGDGGAATSATLNDPQGVAVDSAGNIYIADTNNNAVRMISGGKITSVVGSSNGSAGYTGDGGQGTSAQLFHPSALALDSAGNLFIADTSNEAIRKLTPKGIITTFAGQGGAGFGGDGGLASRAQFSNPSALAFDSAGNLYIADTTNNRIRMISTSGIISTVAGSSSAGYSGDGGPATKARLNSPKGIAIDSSGNLFIADTFNNRIRVVAPYGTIYTVAGTGLTSAGGDGGAAANAGFFFPAGLAATAAGTVFVVDNQNNLVRLLTPIPGATSISAGGVQTAGAFGGAKAVAPGTWIEIYGTNLASSARSWAGGDFVGINAPTSLDGITRVTIGNQPAFIDYMSAGQVNAQVPSGVGTGPQTLTVSSANGISAPYSVTVNATQPGLYAPPSFVIGGKQYLAALFPDGITYVLPPGAIPGVTSRQAKPGETIIVYGVGFGPVTPSSITAGQVVQQSNSLTSPLQVFFGQTPATLTYSGLAPGAVGLYQFNVVVPNVTNSDAVPIAFPVGGVAGTQTLYTAVHN